MQEEYIKRSLQQIEKELKTLGLWAPASPPAEAFESTAPFFHDRMEFSDWLQWVLIPRFRSLLDAGLPFPENCAIAPMAEVQYAQKGTEYGPLIHALRELDNHVMASHGSNQQQTKNTSTET